MVKRNYKRVTNDPIDQTIQLSLEDTGNGQINTLTYKDDLAEGMIKFYGEWELSAFCSAMEALITKLKEDKEVILYEQ